MPSTSMSNRGSILLRYLRSREIEDQLRKQEEAELITMRSLVDRLGLSHELVGHGGCVNCLEWNADGSILASGSDDFHIMLWDPLRNKRLADVDTGHQGNIFSVKFMPQSQDGLIATGAGDGRVKLHLVERGGSTGAGGPGFLQCTCHAGRVKRLATAPDLPYMLWSGAEDGTVMQFDLRAPHDCSSGPTQILINLLCHAGSQTEVKCVSINPLRTEQIAVGANDPFVRLYDRRMIKLTSVQYRNERPRTNWGRHNILAASCRSEENRNAIPAECVQYFTPAHLQRNLDDYRRRFRSLASTYLTFDPSGRYLLVNLGGEHIYLYDCVDSKLPVADLPLHLIPRKDDSLPSNGTHVTSPSLCALPPAVDQLKSQANAAFQQHQYTTAIGLYSKALLLAPKAGVLYSNRAAAYMKRKWDGDVYAALRDCHSAIRYSTDQSKPLLRMARCLQDLGSSTLASEALEIYKEKCPAQSTSLSVRTLEKDIKASKEREVSRQKQQQQQPPNDSSAPSDSGSNESEEPRDAEASLPRVSLEEDHLVDEDRYGILPGSSSRHVSSQESRWRSGAWDYTERFCGHCNTTTDIKEANFFGSKGQYIIAGSDDGCIFMWDRSTGIVERIMRGDDSIVNCLQPHPSTCLIATSGIDSVVRLWSPLYPDGSGNERLIQDKEGAASANQRRMNTDPFEMILMNMGRREEVAGIPVPTFQRRGRARRSPNEEEEEENEGHAAIQCRPS